MSKPVEAALDIWGLTDGRYEFVAGRENRVYRVRCENGDFALRVKRPGYREREELVSELDWLAAMKQAGLHVPRPLPSRNGRLLECVDTFFVDIVSWLPGTPMGMSGHPLDFDNRPGVFRAIGAEMARLHDACDAWTPPQAFTRCHWDVEGLLGGAPLWGRFWENPTLSDETRQLFLRFRQMARERLDELSPGLDYGLIHADLVRENVLLHGETVQLIDFDDGGFGYRLFDLATLLLKNLSEPDYNELKAGLIAGYTGRRALDLAGLDIFMTIRALTYVGWIVPRIHEAGGTLRNERFVAKAQSLCSAFFR
jgi:Ser/Thr protein kinase RdoA (MazF antagonist)